MFLLACDASLPPRNALWQYCLEPFEAAGWRVKYRGLKVTQWKAGAVKDGKMFTVTAELSRVNAALISARQWM
ncbi:MAG: hypothetical protein ACLPT4_11340 [Verrucomicrobiia bacterium]